MVVPRKPTSEWRLWLVPPSCAAHALEEYFTSWQTWAAEVLGLTMSTSWFALINTVLTVAAVGFARIGWRQPTLSLIIPAATLVNAIFFHIAPTIAERRVSPGVYTAILLYLPVSSWVLIGAWRDGVPRRAIIAGAILGAVQMLTVVEVARWSSRLR